jgi:transcription elongation factor SPT4
MRNMRACMICSYVQTMQVRSSPSHFLPAADGSCFQFQKFKANGCPNCEPLLQGLGYDVIDDITSPVFEGLVALREPSKSWVARWQRIEGYEKGIYAVKVSGNVSSVRATSLGM